MVCAEDTGGRPGCVWFKTRKGREYLVYDQKSHGAPHAMNSELFWETKRPFMEKYGVEFANYGGSAPGDPEALDELHHSGGDLVDEGHRVPFRDLHRDDVDARVDVYGSLDELERQMTFLCRRGGESVMWAYPVTAEETPHQVRIDGGAAFSAA